MSGIFARLWARLFADDAGVIMVLWAIVLPVMLGFMGLGIESGAWYLKKRDLHAAADAGAIAGGYATGTGLSNITQVATTEVNRNGFSAANGVSIQVNSPPAGGAYAGNSQSVEVLLSQSQARMFSALLMGADPSISVRSVSLQVSSGNACVLALDPSANSALNFSGNATVSLPTCIAASNSSSTSAVNAAIDLNGSSTVVAEGIYTAGGYSVNGAASLTTTNAPITNGSTIPDPYANLTVPSYSGCNQNNYQKTGHSTVTLSPGVYCNGIRIQGGTVNLQPGVYIIDRGDLVVNGTTTLNGTGVTIILTSSTGTGYGNVTINGGATINLSAPTSGAYAGVVFYQDRNAGTSGTNRFNGGANMNITGAIYFPQQLLDFTGGSSSSATCTQIVGRLITFTGNNNVTSNCPSSGIQNIAVPGSVKLVE